MTVKVKVNSILKTDEELIFKILLGLSPQVIFESDKNYVSEKIIAITPIDEIHLDCHCIDGPMKNGTRQRIL